MKYKLTIVSPYTWAIGDIAVLAQILNWEGADKSPFPIGAQQAFEHIFQAIYDRICVYDQDIFMAAELIELLRNLADDLEGKVKESGIEQAMQQDLINAAISSSIKPLDI